MIDLAQFKKSTNSRLTDHLGSKFEISLRTPYRFNRYPLLVHNTHTTSFLEKKGGLLQVRKVIYNP
jgi:hypothetical protein